MAYNMLMQSELLESILVDANIVMHMMLSSLCTTKSSLAFLCNILQMHHVLCLSCFLCFFASKSIKHRYFCPSFYLFGQNTDINIYTSESSNLSNLQVLSSLERKFWGKQDKILKKFRNLLHLWTFRKWNDITDSQLVASHPGISCSKLTRETLEKCVKYVQS